MHSPLGFASETPRARSALVWAKREVVDNGAKPRSVWAGRTEVWTSAACRSPAIRGEAKGRRAAGDPNLKLDTPHGSDSSADSALEGDGFEFLVRGRGEAGCRAFDAPSYLGRVGSRRSDPANRDRRSREQIPVAVFRVGRSIFDATRHMGVFVVPVAPAKAMVLFRWLQGRLARSRERRIVRS